MTGKTPSNRVAGLSLVEMMIAIVVLSLVSIGVIGYYQSLRRAATTQELSASVEDNLRLGLETLASSLRGARYGVPSSGLAGWTGMSEFTSNPKIADGGTGVPDTLMVASCTSKEVAKLSDDVDAVVDPPTLTLVDTNAPIDDIPDNISDDFNLTNRGLIYIGDSESARITAVSDSTITIDTDPTVAGNQKLSRDYKIGTPICRVDVLTYTVDSGNHRLTRSGVPVADNITDLQITQTTGGIKSAYRIMLTGQSSRKDPATGSVVTRSLTTTVSLRN